MGPAAPARPVEEIGNAWIDLSDGCRLAARMWMPAGAAREPVPAILEYLPYRKDDGTAERDALRHPYVAGRGYACVRVDIRGSGDSDGLLTDEYTETELSDGLEVIEWLAGQPWCTGSVGMMGISWGGFNALQIAALRPPALKGIVTCCSTDDRYADDVHYIGGSVLALDMLRWSTSMMSFLSKPPHPDVVGDRWREMWLRRLGAAPWVHRWLAHQRRDAYWKHGSVCEDYGAIAVPVLTVGGWADGYTDAVFRLLEGLPGPRKALVGPWGHAYPDGALPGPRIGWLDLCIDWWDTWLKGIDRGVSEWPDLRAFVQEPVTPSPRFERRPGRWVGEDTWPSPNVARRTLGLGDGTLVERAGSPVVLRHRGVHTHGVEGGQWCADGDGDLPGDQRFDDARSLTFTSEPLGEAVDLLGRPEAKLRVAADRPVAQLAVRLCDVAPDGTSALVSRGFLNLTHRDGHELPRPLAAGRVYEVTVRMKAIAQVVPAGHRLRLAVSPDYWPWLWPSPVPVTLAVHTGGSEVRLPVRRPAPGDGDDPFSAPVNAPPLDLEVVEPGSGGMTIEHDGRKVTVTHDWDLGGRVRFPDGIASADYNRATYAIDASDPLSARVAVECLSGYGRGDWWTEVRIDSTMTADGENFAVACTLEALENGAPVAEKRWSATLPRDGV